MTREQLDQLKPGDMVVKDKFGVRVKGTVEEVEPDCVFIRFPNGLACMRKGRAITHLNLDLGPTAER